MNMHLMYPNYEPVLIEDAMSTMLEAKENNIATWHVTNIAYLFESQGCYDDKLYNAIFQ